MKFLEELGGGDVFVVDNEHFLLSLDFKKSKTGNSRLCVSLNNGISRWIIENTLVEPVPLFTIDKAGTILAIKETQKTDETNPQN